MHKTPVTQSSAQRHYTNLQGKSGGNDRASYWASVHWKRDVSGRDQIQVMLMGEMDKGCPDNGCNDSREMQGLPVGAFVEGELHLSWMQLFPSPFMPFILYSYCFFFKNLIKGHCPGVVTSGDSVTHKYFHINEKVGS